MAKIEKLKKGTATIYPATIPQAVVDPTSGKSAREELDERATHGYESSPKTLKEVDDEKADHGYTDSPKTLKQVDDSVSQLAGDVALKANHGYDSSPKTLKDIDDEKVNKSSIISFVDENTINNRNFIKECYLYGDGIDTNSIYRINRVSRGSEGAWTIWIRNTDNILVAIYDSVIEENKILHLNEYNNSGINAYLIVDWNVLPSMFYSSDALIYLTDSIFNKFNSPVIYSSLSIKSNQDINPNVSILSNGETLLGKFISDNALKFNFSNGYIVTTGTYLPNITESASYQYVILHVRAGDKYIITGEGTANARIWATANKNGLIINRSDDLILSSYTKTIEEGEDILVINSKIGVTHSLVLANLQTELLSKNRDELTEINSKLNPLLLSYFEVIPSKTDLIPSSWRIYNANDWWLGYYNEVGYYYANASYLLSKQSIYLRKGTYYCDCGSGAENYRWLIYDNTGLLIQILYNGTFTITEDGARAVISTRQADLTKLVLYNVEAIVNSTKQDEEIKAAIRDLTNNGTFYPKGYDFKKLGWAANEADTKNGYYRSSDGVFVEHETYTSTPKIKIPKGVVIDILYWYSDNTGGSGSMGLHLWDNGKYIGCRSLVDADSNDSIVSRTTTLHGSLTRRFRLSPGKQVFDSGTIEISVSGADPNLSNNIMFVQRDSNTFVEDYRPIVKIDTLDDNARLPFDTTILNSTQGNPSAKYTMTVPLGNKFNIRFKFRILENLLNSGSTATIFSGIGEDITAEPVQLTQLTKAYTDGGVEYLSYFPTFNGGVSINGSPTNEDFIVRNLGNYAFSIQYTGEGESATIENNGNALIVKVDGFEVANLSLATYTKMSELYAQLKALPDFVLDYNEIEYKFTSELAKFPETKLISSYKSNLAGVPPTELNQEVYTDAAPLFVPYAVSSKWHQAEIISDGRDVYSSVDGVVKQKLNPLSADSAYLTFGDGNEVLFKDMEFALDNMRDAEIVGYYFANFRNLLISEVSPLIIIYEGHGLFDSASSETANHTGVLESTPDRLQRVWNRLKEKGYVNVTLKDIVEYYQFGKPLPKRSVTFVWDGYRFLNFLNLKQRSAFTRNGLKATCGLSLSEAEPLYFNGNEISVTEAIAIGRNVGFDFCSHSIDHRHMTQVKPSEYITKALGDIYAVDAVGANGSILVYPFGGCNRYLIDTFDFIGMMAAVGIGTQRNSPNIAVTSPYWLSRIEIGLREDMDTVYNSII